MIGVQHEELFPPPLPPTAGRADERIVVKGLSGGPLKDVDLTARSGEVVGLAGLEGSGVVDAARDSLRHARRRAPARCASPTARGLPRSPTDAARRGVCLVPADRRRNGLMLDKSILFNISQVVVGAQPGRLVAVSQRPAPMPGRSARSTSSASRRARRGRLANQLSGGNQQKVVIGKWLEIGPKVFLLDDPTRGVDVGAKREIYGLIRKMSADGGIVLFSSTELPELIGLCDRILVFYQGRSPASSGAPTSRTGTSPPDQHRRDAGRRRKWTRGHVMTDTGSATTAPVSTRRGFRLPEEIGVIVALLLMIVIIGVARPRFLNPLNLLTILGHTTFQGMLAIGMVFLLAIREIDLSVGWMFNFSAVVAALLMVAGVDPWIAALGGVGFGALLGLFNGVLAVALRLPAIIVTLGTYSMFQGLSLVVNQRTRRRPARSVEQLLHVHLDQGLRHRAGRSAGLRRAGGGHALRPPPHQVRLSRPGGRQQPGGGRARRHLQRAGTASDAGADGRDLRPVGRDVYRLPRRHRPERRLGLRPCRGRCRHHRRHAALRRLRHGRSAR